MARPSLTKREIAAHYGRHISWVDLNMRRGMPFTRDEKGWPLFSPSEVDAWLRTSSKAPRMRPWPTTVGR